MTRNFGLAVLTSLTIGIIGCVSEIGQQQGPGPSGSLNPSASPSPSVSPSPSASLSPSASPTPSFSPSPSTPPVTGSSAKALFDANVAQIVTNSCGASTCHGGAAAQIRFAAAPLAGLYDSVLSFSDKLVNSNFDKTRSQILTKIAGGHYAVVYTPTQKTSIEQWLDAEVAARMGGPALPNVRRQLMSQWSGCMTLTDWTADNVAPQWAQKNTGEGTCEACHINAQGFLASRDSQRVFDILTTQVNARTGGMYMEMYFVPDITTDPANPKMIINRAGLERAASGNAQHPRFNVDGNAMTALTSFYTKTMAKKTANTCATPRFMP